MYPNKIISGNFRQSYSIFVTHNGDTYIDNGYQHNRVDKWISNTNTFVHIMSVDSSCYGLFIDLNDTIYCSMYRRNKIIKKSLNDNKMTSTIAAGTGEYGSASNELYGPKGIFVDLNFDLYVADCLNDRVQLFEHGESNGKTLVGGDSDIVTFLGCPSGVVLDADKYLFIVEEHRNRIIRAGPNSFQCLFGCDGEGSQCNQLSSPNTLSFDIYGNIFVTDRQNHRIQKFLFLTSSCGKFKII
jgi:hypothetical protein